MTTVTTDKTDKAADKPENKVTSPGGVTYDLISAYSITIYLLSQQLSNPMGVRVQCIAPSADEASAMVQEFYGEDIINASSPVAVLQDAYITAAPPPPQPPTKRNPANKFLPPEADHHKKK